MTRGRDASATAGGILRVVSRAGCRRFGSGEFSSMNLRNTFLKLAALLVFGIGVCVAQAGSDASFASFEQWKAAVLAGNAAALKAMYSTDPPAHVTVGVVKSDAEEDANFWIGLKARSMKVEVVRNEVRHGHISYIFRAEVQTGLPNGQTVNITDDQSWLQQGDQWRLVAVERTDSPHLAQPANMKKDIYPADADAHAEIKEAEEKAAADHKRLLLVFGANWCFDCHVRTWRFGVPTWRRWWRIMKSSTSTWDRTNTRMP